MMRFEHSPVNHLPGGSRGNAKLFQAAIHSHLLIYPVSYYKEFQSEAFSPLDWELDSAWVMRRGRDGRELGHWKKYRPPGPALWFQLCCHWVVGAPFLC